MAQVDRHLRDHEPCAQQVDRQPDLDTEAGRERSTGLERIATGLRLRKVHPGFIYRSGLVAQRHEVPASALAQARELGATLAAGIGAGLY